MPVVGDADCDGGEGSVLARDASDEGLLLGFVQPLNQSEPGAFQVPLLHPAAERAAKQTTAAATFHCENDFRIVSQSLVM